MAWYDQLFTDLKAYAAAVATDIKAITPRLIPAGGTDGQVLTKNGATTYLTKWSTPAAGGSTSPTNQDSLNTFLQETDRLIDMNVTGNMPQKQLYGHQIIADAAHLVGGISFYIFRTGSVYNPVPFSNAVAIFDTAGNPLAKAETGALYMGSTGWKSAYFTTPITLVAGTRYVLAILGTGDSIPGFGAAPGNSNYNINTPANLPRCFRKSNIMTLGSAITFDSSAPSTDERIFMALIPPIS